MSEEKLKLTFRQSYKSIQSLTAPELPKLVVITGKNGTGKTQLLEAIANQDVTTNLADEDSTSHVSHKDFIFTDQGVVHRQTIEQNKQQYLDASNEIVNELKNNSQILETKKRNILKRIAKAKNKSVYKLDDSDIDDQDLFSEYNTYKGIVLDRVSATRVPDPRFNFIRRVVDNGEDFIEDASDRSFVLSNVINEDFTNGIIPSQLSSVIFDYSLQFHTNQQHMYTNEKFHKNLKVLSESEFERLYGPKPWIMINNLLSKFEGFQYELDFDESTFEPFQSDYSIKFKKKNSEGTAVIVPPQDLSSGEQTILAFVCSLYSASRNRNFPKLLLLDEIDATLHPSMCTSFMKAIKEVLIEKHKLAVVFVTHAPSTVASAPNDSIYVLEDNDGDHILEPQNATKALQILSSGFIGVTEEENKLVLEHKISSTEKGMLFFEGKSDVFYMTEALTRFKPSLLETIELSGCEGFGGLDKLHDVLKSEANNVLTHGRKAILVYDCEMTRPTERRSHLVRFTIDPIENAPISIGIENLLTTNIINRLKSANDQYLYDFKNELRINDSNKMDAAKWICKNAQDEDFEHFKTLIDKIESYS